MSRRGGIAAVTALAALLLPCAAYAQASENRVKAEFLPRFARYVTWPATSRPQPGQAFQLCLVGGDPFGRAVDESARNQSIDGHRLTVRRVESASDADGCHVVFVNGTRTRPAGQALATLGRRPVLTVTDARNSSQRGIIHFVTVSGRVRFFIDERQAAERGLAINSRLLALAVGVQR